MSAQAEKTASTQSDPTTLDEIKVLAPMTEEWAKSINRQYHAAKGMISAEWSLIKRSFAAIIALTLFFVAFITAAVVMVNVAIVYGIILLDLHWALGVGCAVLVDLIFAWILSSTIKGMASNISFDKSKSLLFASSEKIKRNVEA